MGTEIDTQRQDGLAKMEAGMAAMLPQTKDWRAPPKARRSKEAFFARPLWGVWPHRHLDFRLWPPELRENRFLSFSAI